MPRGGRVTYGDMTGDKKNIEICLPTQKNRHTGHRNPQRLIQKKKRIVGGGKRLYLHGITGAGEMSRYLRARRNLFSRRYRGVGR